MKLDNIAPADIPIAKAALRFMRMVEIGTATDARYKLPPMALCSSAERPLAAKSDPEAVGHRGEDKTHQRRPRRE